MVIKSSCFQIRPTREKKLIVRKSILAYFELSSVVWGEIVSSDTNRVFCPSLMIKILILCFRQKTERQIHPDIRGCGRTGQPVRWPARHSWAQAGGAIDLHGGGVVQADAVLDQPYWEKSFAWNNFVAKGIFVLSWWNGVL